MSASRTMAEVRTPIAQAMQEGVLSRRELKQFMHRSDKPALLRLLLWILLVGLTGSTIWYFQNSWLVVPAMFVHGIVLVHHFSLQHECCHYTAFKTRWLNDVVGNICGLIIMLPNRFFRYEHCDHHTYTQVKGKDTEMIEMPQSLAAYFYYLSSIPYWKAKFSEVWRHSIGHISAAEKRFVPLQERRAVVLEARCMVGLYCMVFILSLIIGSTFVIWYWLLPVILGEPVMRAIRMTEHVGRPTVADMKINTRSNPVSRLFRFLCWNMNYHAEHHYASSVPFHALPALSKKLNGHLFKEHGGYVGAHKSIISQILKT